MELTALALEVQVSTMWRARRPFRAARHVLSLSVSSDRYLRGVREGALHGC
jgi:hypothetical protein